MKNTMRKISNYVLVGNAIATVIFGFFWPMGIYYLGAIFAWISLVALVVIAILKYHDSIDGQEECCKESTPLFKKKDDSEKNNISSSKKVELNEEEQKEFDAYIKKYQKALVDGDDIIISETKFNLNQVVKKANDRKAKEEKAKKTAETKARKKAAEEEAEKLRRELLGE